MKCFKVKSKLSAYIDGELRGKWGAKVEKHLTKCNYCKQDLNLLRESYKILDILGEISPSESFDEKFWQRIKESERQQLTSKTLWKRTGVSYVAGLLIICVGLFWGIWSANLIYLKENSLSGTKEISQIEKLLYLETFDDIPPDSIGGIYISLNSKSKNGF